MQRNHRTVVLLGVKSAQRRAIEDLSIGRGLAVADVEGPPSGDVALCVFADGGAGETPLAALSRLRSRFPGAPCVALLDEPDPDVASLLRAAGVADVVPASDGAPRAAERCLRWAASVVELRDLTEIVGASEAIENVRQLIRDGAATDATILVTGETGTGKGLVARACHALSRRAAERWVHVDCSALSPAVVESELFGHEGGAFAGAVADRKGRFELAGDGTLFLDEIGELGGGLQSKLLRVLQDREFERIGGDRTLRMTARLVAATSRDLGREMIEGRFRSELYYRLSVFRIHIPPLRDRPRDIPPLVAHGLAASAERLGVPPPSSTEGFLELALAHRWRGNVRELFNTLERLVIRSPGRPLERRDLETALEQFPPIPAFATLPARAPLAVPDPPPPRARSRSRPARVQIAAVLMETGGNIARASRRLAVPRSTLRYWIEQHALEDLIPRD